MSRSFIKVEIDDAVVGFHNPVTEAGGEDLADFGQVYEFSWGATREIGQNATVRGHTHMQAMKVTKDTDQGAPLLLQALHRGSVVKVTVITVVNDLESGAEVLASTWTGHNGRIGSFQTHGAYREEDSTASTSEDEIDFYFQSLDIEVVYPAATATLLDWSGTGS